MRLPSAPVGGGPARRLAASIAVWAFCGARAQSDICTDAGVDGAELDQAPLGPDYLPRCIKSLATINID